MTRLTISQFPKIIGIAGDDDAILGDRSRETVSVRRAQKPQVADMRRVESVHEG